MTELQHRPQAEAATVLRDGRRALIRPLRPTDAQAQRRFIEGLSARSRRARFLCTMSSIDDRTLALLMAPDARGPTALVAVVPGDDGERIVGVARLAQSGDRAEISISVDDAWQGAGLGTALFRRLEAMARERGITQLWSLDAASNTAMHAFARALGARCHGDPEDASQMICELPVS